MLRIDRSLERLRLDIHVNTQLHHREEAQDGQVLLY